MLNSKKPERTIERIYIHTYNRRLAAQPMAAAFDNDCLDFAAPLNQNPTRRP